MKKTIESNLPEEQIRLTEEELRSVIAEQCEALTETEDAGEIAKCKRYLLALCSTVSAAMNRMAVDMLEAKLQSTQGDEMGDQAREALGSVLEILREQSGSMAGHERITAQIADTKKAVRTHGREIESIHRVDAEQRKKDAEHDSLIAQNADKNAQQDSELRHQKEVDKQHEARLKRITGLSVAALIAAIAALILSIVQFFL